MEPLLIGSAVAGGLVLFFGAGLAVGYFIAKRGFQKRLVVLNTPEDYREQGARLITEALDTRKVEAEMAMRRRAFEHFRMADIIENTGPVTVATEVRKSA